MSEYTLVEAPIIKALTTQYHYTFLPKSSHSKLRARENEVLLRPRLIAALQKLNRLSESEAGILANELARLESNQRWTEILRGHFSRKLRGEDHHSRVRLIDFDEPANNDFLCLNQFKVEGTKKRIPDVVIFVNGIPLVVIEAKSPLNRSQNTFDAIDQIRSLEKEVPRLFYSNLLNIATNDLHLMYGATGAAAEYWSQWRDPWPRKEEEFPEETAKGLYALLEPSRLLDLLAHFVVFETREGTTVKKVCRYQQFRAVNKMVQRVVKDEARAGLIWHTQGSGKSLTMVFAAMKLKFHYGLHSERLQNPNLLILTDRVDLHEQISSTFLACGLPNPQAASSIRGLKELLVPGVRGRTVLSTIFKFHWDDKRLFSKDERERQRALKALEVKGSENWIVMVDEAHRTQEKDLGAYLQAILPKAVRFGFTGTPVKKGDKNTFRNFGAAGENYLDKYGIDDAVRDGATVPIYYMGRLTEWNLYDKELDATFDQWFAGEPEEKREEIKRRGLTRGDLARFKPRIDLIAVDIWAHFRAHVQPDGFKAQVVAIDRLACVRYKQALDRVIANTLSKREGLSQEEAQRRAGEMSVCVYSPGQHDKEQNPELVTYQTPPEEVSSRVLPRFQDPSDPLSFLIVCNKLLTGFDAPIEQAMYLDNPLKDHNLLQAIARTNRRYGNHKSHGLIVDYIGVSKKLSEALENYRKEDVAAAMEDLEVLHDRLKMSHKAVMKWLSQFPRTGDDKTDALAVVDGLGSEDRWLEFRGHADNFLRAYSTLSPEKRILAYRADLKFVGIVLPYGRLRFEQVEDTDWRSYSEKIRGMLAEHLEVTGLKTVCQQRSLDDVEFWEDFHQPGELKTAAVRKLSELKKITYERSSVDPARYGSFSERVKELLKQFNQGLLEASRVLEETKQLAEALRSEESAHKGTGLSKRAYSIASILREWKPPAEEARESTSDYESGATKEKQGLSELEKAASEIDALYASDDSAPPYWQDKTQLKKELRKKVRSLIKELGYEKKIWYKSIPDSVEQFALIHYRKP